MPKPRTVLGPGILSAALALTSCGSPNPRIDDAAVTKHTGAVAAAAAPLSVASASASIIRTDLGGAGVEHRSSGSADGA